MAPDTSFLAPLVFQEKTQSHHQQKNPEKPSQQPKSHPPSAAPRPQCGRESTLERWVVNILPPASCAFMIYSCFTALWESHGDPSRVFFIVSSLTILAALYATMRQFERAVAQKDDLKRDRLRVAIWLLAMLLNAIFSYRVCSVLQSRVMNWIVYLIAVFTTLLGAYLLFFLPKTRPTTQHQQQPPIAPADVEQGGKQ